METNILVVALVFFSALFIVNKIKFKEYDEGVKKQLLEHNKRVVFVNNDCLDIRNECYKPSEFFLMSNSGRYSLSKEKDFNYVSYSTKEDYYLN